MTKPMTDAEIYAEITRLAAIDATAATTKDRADMKALIHAQLDNVGARFTRLQDSHAALLAAARTAAHVLEGASSPITFHPPAVVAGRIAAARAILEVAIAEAEKEPE